MWVRSIGDRIGKTLLMHMARETSFNFLKTPIQRMELFTPLQFWACVFINQHHLVEAML